MSLYPFFDDNSGGVRYGIDNKSLTCDDLYCAYLSGEADLGKFILAYSFVLTSSIVTVKPTASS